jgi:phage shock protein A
VIELPVNSLRQELDGQMEHLKEVSEKKLLDSQQELDILTKQLNEMKYGSAANEVSKQVRERDTTVSEMESRMKKIQEKYLQVHNLLEGSSIGFVRIAELLGDKKVDIIF